MKTNRQQILACVLGVLLLAPGLAAAQASGQHGGQTASAGGAEGGGMTMMSAMQENQKKMTSMQMSGDTDVDFAMMMREHHLGAIRMAEAELREGKDGKMRDMAKTIIAAQKKEIAQFDAFLSKKGHSMDKASK